MASKLPLYRGFSTATYFEKKSFSLTNEELVKRDLLNHIWTIRGERPHQPNFGTRIPLLAFEPLDQKTLSIIKEDLTAVFKYDPRIELVDIAISAVPDLNTVVAFVDIKYLELNTTETLKLEIEVGA